MLSERVHLGVLHGLDLDRALHDARGPVLLVVTKPGCGACRAIKAVLADLSPIVGLVAWEVDAGSAPALIDELGVFHLPALWLFEDGEPVGPIEAPPVPARLHAALLAALARGR